MERNSESPTGLPDSSENTMAKIACIEQMLHRMQHPSQASDVFLEEMLQLINKEDVVNMVDLQMHMLSRFEKTNEMLLNFNSLSMARYETTCQDFKNHTQILINLKQDLENVFKRIRSLKTKLRSEYSVAFQEMNLDQ